MAGELLDEVDKFAALLRRGNSTKIRVGPTKTTAAALTAKYFGQRRPDGFGDAALGHHLDEISIAEPIRQVPAHA
jgi:hypothetical protein